MRESERPRTTAFVSYVRAPPCMRQYVFITDPQFRDFSLQNAPFHNNTALVTKLNYSIRESHLVND